jgi:hypothetical protein
MFNVKEKLKALAALQSALDACRKAGIYFDNTTEVVDLPKRSTTSSAMAPEGLSKKGAQLWALMSQGANADNCIGYTVARDRAKKLNLNRYSAAQILRRMAEDGHIVIEEGIIHLK